MGEPRKAELPLSVASCMLWQTAGSSRKALLDLAPLFLGEPGNKQPFLQYTPAPCLRAGRLQQCGTQGKAARDRGKQMATGISTLLSKICTDSLTCSQPPLQLPTHSFHNNQDNCFPKCHRISLLTTHIGAGLTWDEEVSYEMFLDGPIPGRRLEPMTRTTINIKARFQIVGGDRAYYQIQCYKGCYQHGSEAYI